MSTISTKEQILENDEEKKPGILFKLDGFRETFKQECTTKSPYLHDYTILKHAESKIRILFYGFVFLFFLLNSYKIVRDYNITTMKLQNVTLKKTQESINHQKKMRNHRIQLTLRQTYLNRYKKYLRRRLITWKINY